MRALRFKWDPEKDAKNIVKHRISFLEAQATFFDPKRVIVMDHKHSGLEQRYFCIGSVSEKVITVRFTHRGDNVRIIGAGFWRDGRTIYEEKNRTIH